MRFSLDPASVAGDGDGGGIAGPVKDIGHFIPQRALFFGELTQMGNSTSPKRSAVATAADRNRPKGEGAYSPYTIKWVTPLQSRKTLWSPPGKSD